MTNGNDRLEQIEALLQQFMAASDQRMTRLEQTLERDRQESNARMTRLEQTLERDRQESNARMTRIEERLEQMAENQETTDAQVGVLVTAIDTLAEEVRRIVHYLENQSGNGRGGTGG